MNLLQIPKIQMFLSLLAITIFAVTLNFSVVLIIRYLVIFGFTLLIEYIFWKIRGINPFLPSASFVTATIIFLLSDTTLPIYFSLIAVSFAILQKQYIRPWGNHIFNPAAFGLFFSAYFGNIIGWWGPNSGMLILFLIIIAAGYVSAIRLNQWKIIVPFLLTTILLTRNINQLTVGAFLFFTFVMLPEPMTAAKENLTKPIYGILVAVLPFLLIRLPLIPDIELFALLLGNLTFMVADHYLEVKN